MTRSMQVINVCGGAAKKSPGWREDNVGTVPRTQGDTGATCEILHPPDRRQNVQWGTKIIVHNDRVISVSVLFSSDSTCFQSERSRNIVYVYYLLLERRE